MHLVHGGASPLLQIDNAWVHSFAMESVRAGLYGADDPSITQIVEDADDKLSQTFYQTHMLHYTT